MGKENEDTVKKTEKTGYMDMKGTLEIRKYQ